MQCSVEGCFRKTLARGWCQRHYRHWRDHGDPLAGRFWGTCSRGHDLTVFENVALGKAGKRQCKICLRVAQRAYKLMDKFGLTVEQWEDMFDSQDRSCKICWTTEETRWSVDHDHACCPTVVTCGACVRGILCFQCNLRVRALDEWSPEELSRAQEYVKRQPILSA